HHGLIQDGVAGPQTLSHMGLSPSLGCGGSEAGISGYATVRAGSGLNVRAYPGGPIIGGLAYGQTVAITDSSGGWYEVAGGGWVSGNWLSFGGSGGGGEVPVGSGAYVNAAVGLNVRSSPGGAVWYALPNGASVTLTGASQFAAGRTWVQLTDGGWVAQDFISYN
ncbi:MAG TPA: SH3 domain-containing protein, partial [Coleofasciculaceae cyanobacterium]